MTTEEPFNLAAALEHMAGEMDLLKEIAAVFLEDYPCQLAQINAALAAGDANRVMRAAHSLKGSVGNFEAAGAFEAACVLEIAARRGDLAASQAGYALLNIEMARLKEALTKLLAPSTTRPS